MQYIYIKPDIKFLVDDEDFISLSKFQWRSLAGYVHTYVNGMKVYAHRMIMNAPTGKQVDHINRDKLDNRKENLRLCTLAENNRNVAKRSTKTSSRYRGVMFNKHAGKWESRIRLNGKSGNIGLFRTQEQAAMAHDLWARELHGDFASYNFECE